MDPVQNLLLLQKKVVLIVVMSLPSPKPFTTVRQLTYIVSITITSNQGAVIENKLVVKFAPFSHQAATFPELCVKGMIYMRLTL